jgi:hypothetical protein
MPLQRLPDIYWVTPLIRLPMPSPASALGGPETRTSVILVEFAATFPQERIQLRDLGRLLGNRSFGFLLLIFALPSTLPIPGMSTLTGIPMALLALQMMWGLPGPHLPHWLADRSLPRDQFRHLVEKSAPALRRLERVMRPRWPWLTGPAGERLLGAFCLVLAVVLALPIPLGNLLPALSVALIALGMIEKDGLLVAAGGTLGVVGLAVVWGVVWTMGQGVLLFMRHLFA